MSVPSFRLMFLGREMASATTWRGIMDLWDVETQDVSEAFCGICLSECILSLTMDSMKHGDEVP